MGGTEYKTSAVYIRDRHSQARVKDFGEMSSVSIVVLSEPRWGRIEARKKNTGQIWNFCFRPTLVYNIEGQKEGKDTDGLC